MLNEAVGEWVSILTSHSDAYVVNVGQMLTAWTAGAYRSSLHWVINNTYSSSRAIWKPHLAAGREPDEEVKTVEQHLLECMSRSNGKKGKQRFISLLAVCLTMVETSL